MTLIGEFAWKLEEVKVSVPIRAHKQFESDSQSSCASCATAERNARAARKMCKTTKFIISLHKSELEFVLFKTKSFERDPKLDHISETQSYICIERILLQPFKPQPIVNLENSYNGRDHSTRLPQSQSMSCLPHY